jgi:hypothetical protein
MAGCVVTFDTGGTTMPLGPVRRGHPLLRGALAGRGVEPPEPMTEPEPSGAIHVVNGRDPGLSQLAQLRKQSLLSEDEYEAARARLLDT